MNDTQTLVQQLRQDVSELVTKFQNESGFKVESLQVSNIDASSKEGKSFIVSNIEIKLSA